MSVGASDPRAGHGDEKSSRGSSAKERFHLCWHAHTVLFPMYCRIGMREINIGRDEVGLEHCANFAQRS